MRRVVSKSATGLWVRPCSLVRDVTSKPLPHTTGRTPGVDDVLPFSAAVGQMGSSTDISSLITHGTKLYSTVTCSNNAGRSTTAVSNGVTYLSSPPSSALATVNIASTTPTLYEPRGGYLPSDSFLVSWNGFVDGSSEPLRYQVRLVAGGTSLGPGDGWTEVGDLKQLAINNVTASEGMVEVRAYLMEGLTSSPATESFIISSSQPIYDGRH